MQQTTIAKLENHAVIPGRVFRLGPLEVPERLEAILGRWRMAWESHWPLAEPESRDTARELNGKLEIRLPDSPKNKGDNPDGQLRTF